MTKIFCSWSGGKDSCLALHRAVEAGAELKYFLTMFTENADKSRSHGLDVSIIRAQADSIKVELVIGNASWDKYQQVFLDKLTFIKEQGVTTGVFGDIDIEDHRTWVKSTCESVGTSAWHPLWQEERLQLLQEFVGLGYKAMIVSCQNPLADLLGREFDQSLMDELISRGVDPCGEAGEFHTVVVDGPLFSRPIVLKPGGILTNQGYSFLEYSLDQLIKVKHFLCQQL